LRRRLVSDVRYHMGQSRRSQQSRQALGEQSLSQTALERLLARERERSRRLRLRLAHARLAARLLAARRSEARALIAAAGATVDRWERGRLCSRHYISRWRAMLAGPVDRVARSLLETGEWTDALFQTTPWAFALERPRRRQAGSVA
jgi:hypothetical protein